MKKKKAHPTPCVTCGHDSLHGEVSGCVSMRTDPSKTGKWCDCTQYVPTRNQVAGLRAGRAAAAEGMAAAADGFAMTHDTTAWRPRAQARLDELIAKRADFTAEDVTDVVGPAPSPNAIGSLFRGARDRMEVGGFTVASRPEARGRALRVWTGKP